MDGRLETQNIGGGYGGFGGGWGGIAPVGLFGIIGGRGFGERGGDCGGTTDNGGHLGQAIYGSTVLGKLGSIEGAIPQASLETQNAILEQTNALNIQINQANLSQLQASANVKDTVQNAAAFALVNANQNTQSILNSVALLSSKIDQNRISELESQLASQRFDSRSRDVEVNVNQTVAQAQQQNQFQAQLQGLFGVVSNLANDIQAVRQGQVIFNSGTMAASGTQAAANTKVN